MHEQDSSDSREQPNTKTSQGKDHRDKKIGVSACQQFWELAIANQANPGTKKASCSKRVLVLYRTSVRALNRLQGFQKNEAMAFPNHPEQTRPTRTH